MRIGFATSNPHKLAEVRRLLAGFDVVALDVGAVDETGETFAENACIKARAARGRAPVVVAEDSGLEVDGLRGAPGVYSARYAATDAGRIDRVLRELAGGASRRARFVAAVCALRGDGEPRVFEGVVEGVIAPEPRGDAGFGYDPIFIPLEGDGRTFAELGAEKDRFSHRARAFAKLATWLTTTTSSA